MSNSTSTQEHVKRVNPFIIKEINNGLDIKVSDAVEEGTRNELFSYLISFLKKQEESILEIIAGNDAIIEVFEEDTRVNITIDSKYGVTPNIQCLKELLRPLNNIEVSPISGHSPMKKCRNTLNGNVKNVRCGNTDKIYKRKIDKEEIIITVNQAYPEELRSYALNYLMLFLKNNLFSISTGVKEVEFTIVVNKEEKRARIALHKTKTTNNGDIDNANGNINRLLDTIDNIGMPAIVGYAKANEEALEKELKHKPNLFIFATSATVLADSIMLQPIKMLQNMFTDLMSPMTDIIMSTGIKDSQFKEDEVKAYKNNETNQSVKQEMRMCARRTSCDKKYIKDIKDAYTEYSRENVNENDYVFAPLNDGKYIMLYEMVGYVKYNIVIPINLQGKKGKGKCYFTNNPILTINNLIRQGIMENGCKVTIIKPYKA